VGPKAGLDTEISLTSGWELLNVFQLHLIPYWEYTSRMNIVRQNVYSYKSHTTRRSHRN
jgi:hypothetical protein